MRGFYFFKERSIIVSKTLFKAKEHPKGYKLISTCYLKLLNNSSNTFFIIINFLYSEHIIK